MRRGSPGRRALAALLIGCLGCATPGAPPLPAPGSPEYDAFSAAFHVGVAALQVDNREFAQKGLERAAEVVPGEPAVWANLGLHELRVGDLEKAGRHLERAAGLAPESDAIEELRGLAADRRGQVDAAVTHLTRAVELRPANLKARM